MKMLCPDCGEPMRDTNRCNAYDRWTRHGLEQDEYEVYACDACGIEQDTRDAEREAAEEALDRHNDRKFQEWKDRGL